MKDSRSLWRQRFPERLQQGSHSEGDEERGHRPSIGMGSRACQGGEAELLWRTVADDGELQRWVAGELATCSPEGGIAMARMPPA